MADDQRPTPDPLAAPVAAPRGGDGPKARGRWSQKDDHHPAAGWGAAKAVTRFIVGQRTTLASGRRCSS